VSGFPNLFQLVGPNTALGHNSIIFMIEAQVNYIIQCIRKVQEKGVDYFNVKIEEQNKYNAEIQGRMKNTVWTSGCKSWYQQDNGKNFTIWPSSTLEYRARTKKVFAPYFDWISIADQKTEVADKAEKSVGKEKKSEPVSA